MTTEEYDSVLGHIKNVHNEFTNLYKTMNEISFKADKDKKRAIHRMLDKVVTQQKEFDKFYKNFNK